MGRATRPRRNHRRAIAGEAGDALEADGVEGFGEGHRRQDGKEATREPRRPSTRVPSIRRLWSERLHDIVSACAGGVPGCRRSKTPRRRAISAAHHHSSCGSTGDRR